MKKVIIRNPYEVVLEEVANPEIDDNQFLVKTILTAISAGTELTKYKGTNPGFLTGRYHYPTELGYEHVGKVVKVGRDVENVSIGDRVVTTARHAEYAVINKDMPTIYDLYGILPEDFNPEEAVFVPLTTTATHTIHRSKIMLGDTVGIVGLGVVGMLTAQVAKAAGASKVIGIDLLDSKLKIAKKLGVDVAINPNSVDIKERVFEETDGQGVDIAIESSGVAKAVGSALDIVRKRGKVVIEGFHAKPFEVSGEDILTKELEIIGVRSSGGPDLSYEYIRWSAKANYQEAFRLIISGKVKCSTMITHRFKAEEINKAYEMIDKKKEDFLKVILDWKQV